MNEICKKHVDACRFCWMCRHICPIGNATGLERNTSRARALGLSLVNRGVYDIAEVADNLYECAGCGACTKECVTGWDPVMFTKAARLDAALAGKLPPYIEKLVNACLETGNAYGKTTYDAALTAAVARHAAKTDVLFLLGVDAAYMAPATAINAIAALEKAGCAFTVLENEPATGAQLAYLIGKAEEAKEQMRKCTAALADYKTVIAFDPQDAKFLKRDYKEWDVALVPAVLTFPAALLAALEKGDLKPEQTARRAVYQDPFALSRDLGEIEEPRKLIAAYLTLDEMLCHGKDTMWAGNILMAEWMPDVIRKVAENRIRDARGVGADLIVTASPSEYAALAAVAQSEVKILSLEELVLGK